MSGFRLLAVVIEWKTDSLAVCAAREVSCTEMKTWDWTWQLSPTHAYLIIKHGKCMHELEVHGSPYKTRIATGP